MNCFTVSCMFFVLRGGHPLPSHQPTTARSEALPVPLRTQESLGGPRGWPRVSPMGVAHEYGAGDQTTFSPPPSQQEDGKPSPAEHRPVQHSPAQDSLAAAAIDKMQEV